MSTAMARRAIRLWTSPMVTRKQNRANQRKWLAAVVKLGDKWLIANPQGRRTQ